jgi:hypothetical protein
MQDGGMPLQHFIPPKDRFLVTEFKNGKQKTEMFSKRLFGWYKDRKNEKTVSCRMHNRGI